MIDGVPNLRGGGLTWAAFILGPLLGALVTGAIVVWVIAKMPDGNQFHEVTRDVAGIKLDVAVMRSRQDGADERNKRVEGLLEQLIGQKRK